MTMDMLGTQQWIASLFTGEEFEWVEPVDDAGAPVGGQPLGISAQVIATCTFAERDLNLVHGAQVWGMQNQDVRVELFGLVDDGVTPDLMQVLLSPEVNVEGLQPGRTVEIPESATASENLPRQVHVVAPTRWEQGLPQLGEPDRITVLLQVQPV